MDVHATAIHNGMRGVCYSCNTFFSSRDQLSSHQCIASNEATAGATSNSAASPAVKDAIVEADEDVTDVAADADDADDEEEEGEDIGDEGVASNEVKATPLTDAASLDSSSKAGSNATSSSSMSPQFPSKSRFYFPSSPSSKEGREADSPSSTPPPRKKIFSSSAAETYQCSTCGKGYASKLNFVAHLQIHQMQNQRKLMNKGKKKKIESIMERRDQTGTSSSFSSVAKSSGSFHSTAGVQQTKELEHSVYNFDDQTEPDGTAASLRDDVENKRFEAPPKKKMSSSSAAAMSKKKDKSSPVSALSNDKKKKTSFLKSASKIRQYGSSIASNNGSSSSSPVDVVSRSQMGFPCPSCDKVCKYQFQLAQHFSAAHKGILVFPCPIPGCQRNLPTIALVHKHVRLVHGKKTLTTYKMARVVHGEKAGEEGEKERLEGDEEGGLEKEYEDEEVSMEIVTLAGKIKEAVPEKTKPKTSPKTTTTTPTDQKKPSSSSNTKTTSSDSILKSSSPNDCPRLSSQDIASLSPDEFVQSIQPSSSQEKLPQPNPSEHDEPPNSALPPPAQPSTSQELQDQQQQPASDAKDIFSPSIGKKWESKWLKLQRRQLARITGGLVSDSDSEEDDEEEEEVEAENKNSGKVGEKRSEKDAEAAGSSKKLNSSSSSSAEDSLASPPSKRKAPSEGDWSPNQTTSHILRNQAASTSQHRDKTGKWTSVDKDDDDEGKEKDEKTKQSKADAIGRANGRPWKKWWIKKQQELFRKTAKDAKKAASVAKLKLNGKNKRKVKPPDVDNSKRTSSDTEKDDVEIVSTSENGDLESATSGDDGRTKESASTDSTAAASLPTPTTAAVSSSSADAAAEKFEFAVPSAKAVNKTVSRRWTQSWLYQQQQHLLLNSQPENFEATMEAVLASEDFLIDSPPSERSGVVVDDKITEVADKISDVAVDKASPTSSVVESSSITVETSPTASKLPSDKARTKHDDKPAAEFLKGKSKQGKKWAQNFVAKQQQLYEKIKKLSTASCPPQVRPRTPSEDAEDDDDNEEANCSGEGGGGSGGGGKSAEEITDSLSNQTEPPESISSLTTDCATHAHCDNLSVDTGICLSDSGSEVPTASEYLAAATPQRSWSPGSGPGTVLPPSMTSTTSRLSVAPFSRLSTSDSDNPPSTASTVITTQSQRSSVTTDATEGGGNLCTDRDRAGGNPFTDRDIGIRSRLRETAFESDEEVTPRVDVDEVQQHHRRRLLLSSSPSSKTAVESEDDETSFKHHHHHDLSNIIDSSRDSTTPIVVKSGARTRRKSSSAASIDGRLRTSKDSSSKLRISELSEKQRLSLSDVVSRTIVTLNVEMSQASDFDEDAYLKEILNECILGNSLSLIQTNADQHRGIPLPPILEEKRFLSDSAIESSSKESSSVVGDRLKVDPMFSSESESETATCYYPPKGSDEEEEAANAKEEENNDSLNDDEQPRETNSIQARESSGNISASDCKPSQSELRTDYEPITQTSESDKQSCINDDAVAEDSDDVFERSNASPPRESSSEVMMMKLERTISEQPSVPLTSDGVGNEPLENDEWRNGALPPSTDDSNRPATALRGLITTTTSVDKPKTYEPILIRVGPSGLRNISLGSVDTASSDSSSIAPLLSPLPQPITPPPQQQQRPPQSSLLPSSSKLTSTPSSQVPLSSKNNSHSSCATTLTSTASPPQHHSPSTASPPQHHSPSSLTMKGEMRSSTLPPEADLGSRTLSSQIDAELQETDAKCHPLTKQSTSLNSSASTNVERRSSSSPSLILPSIAVSPPLPPAPPPPLPPYHTSSSDDNEILSTVKPETITDSVDSGYQPYPPLPPPLPTPPTQPSPDLISPKQRCLDNQSPTLSLHPPLPPPPPPKTSPTILAPPPPTPPSLQQSLSIDLPSPQPTTPSISDSSSKRKNRRVHKAPMRNKFASGGRCSLALTYGRLYGAQRT